MIILNNALLQKNLFVYLSSDDITLIDDFLVNGQILL